MEDMNLVTFQNKVGKMLTRHKSILDLLTKYQESAARVNRAIVKSVTSCGCVEIDAKKQNIPSDIDFSNLKDYMDTHLNGVLCESCLDAVEKEIGNHLFYLAGLANTLDISLEDILSKEDDKLNTLGLYHFR